MKPGSSAQSELLGQLDLDDLPVLDDQRNGPEPHAPKDGSHPQEYVPFLTPELGQLDAVVVDGVHHGGEGTTFSRKLTFSMVTV